MMSLEGQVIVSHKIKQAEVAAGTCSTSLMYPVVVRRSAIISHRCLLGCWVVCPLLPWGSVYVGCVRRITTRQMKRVNRGPSIRVRAIYHRPQVL